MRIPTGNFGNAVPTPQPTRVNVSGTGAIGQAVAGLADDVKQEINAVVRARAGDAMLDYQIKLKDINESIRRGVEDGTLRADQVENVYHEAVGKLEKPQFSGLGIAETQVAEGGLKRYESDGLTTAQGYARAALKIEARDQVDSGLDKLAKLTNYPGADIEKINAMSTAYEEQGRLAYGAQWAKVRQSWVDRNWFNQAQQRVMESRDNGAALSDLSNQLTSEKGFYIDKLDPDKRNALLYQAMGYQSRLEAKAIAAQNHADMLVLRRENAATHASSSMQMRIANGEIPTYQDWNTYLTTIAGTSQDGTASTLRRAMVTTQKLYAMPPEQAQAQIDNWTLEMRKNGGSKEAYKVLNAVQQNIDQRRAELQKNPQAVGAMDAGTALQPLDARSAIQTPGEWGQGLQTRLVNSNAISQKYGPAAGKSLLTPTEASDTKEYYQKLTPDQRVQFWRNTAASGGTEVANRLAREVGGNALPVAAVASTANTPQGYSTALTIERGVSLINPVEGVAKAQVPKASSISEAIQDEYPDFTAAQVQRLIPVVTAYHVGKGGASDDTPSRDDLHAVIGEPVKVFGGSVVAPPGSNSDAFKKALTTQINRLPELQARTVRNNLGDGIYAFTPDDSGNMRLFNVKTQRVILVDGKPFVAEVK